MNSRKFFRKKTEFLTLSQVLEISGSNVDANVNLELKIFDVATLLNAKKDEISFLNSGKYFATLETSNAGFCIIEEASAKKSLNKNTVFIVSKNPYFSYSQIVSAFYEEFGFEFDSKKLISDTAIIGSGTKIAPNVYIGNNVEIGENCKIASNVSIMDNCKIGNNTIINSGATISYCIMGDNCIIYSGARIGQDGFGFAHNNGVNHKIIQIGIVEIGNNVEIGANSCVDRGAIENTIISSDVKIDNLVQIGHNVKIGKGTVIAGKSAIAGSAIIGNYVQIGGCSAISGHITINDGAKIAGMSGVMRDVETMTSVGGAPAIPFRDWHRLNSKLIELSKSKT